MPPVIYLIAVVIGLVPAAIASNKGRSFLGWWIFGAALFIVALPCAIFIQPASAAGTQRPCPHCMATIPAAATVCSHCTREVPLGTRPIKCPACGTLNAVPADLSDWGCGNCRQTWSLHTQTS